MTRPKRPLRAERREASRAATKLVRERERLARLAPGGSPEHPINVPSASVVETSARSSPCPQCGGALRVDEHAARVIAGSRLRVVTATCIACGARRDLHYRIDEPS